MGGIEETSSVGDGRSTSLILSKSSVDDGAVGKTTTDGGSPHDVIGLRSQYARKEFVPTSFEGYEVSGVTFTIMSAEDILRYSEVKVCNKELYFPMTSQPMPFGVLDSRLGASKASGQCKTCGHTFQDCTGHWGYIPLHQPVFHVGYFKHLLTLLYCICKKCSKLLLSNEDKAIFLQRSRRCHDPIMRRALLKRLIAKCKREMVCLDPDCSAPQGLLRRVMKPSLDQFMKIVFQKKIRRDGIGSVASRTTIVNEDLDGRFIYRLLQNISPLDCEVLDVKMPEKFLISSLVVPPKCIRPSVTLGDSGTNEDDLTVVFSEIVDLNNMIGAQCNAGLQSSSVLSTLEFLQLQCTRFINSEAPAVGPLLATKNITSPGRGICQRLKGKEGRFRGNLSGKRVDFSGRTVISPDANCPIDEVVIPQWSAKRLTFPENVCEATIEKLRAAVLKGDEWPGAAFVHKKDGGRTSLKYANRRDVAENLQYGDIVERHLWNGDIVLFNRQPSLHRLSIMAHKARVMPWRTFRFNECVCAPYNADFDGDEMNCHLPQTQEARAEAYHLMGVVNNLVTPKNGEPLIAATQDFLSGSYLLTSKDTFFTRERFCLYCCYFTDGRAHIDLPPPTILKPVELWTGKQVINVLLRPNRYCPNVLVSFEVKEREFTKPLPGEPNFMCPREGYVVFRNSELMAGALAKTTLGNGSKKGLFFHLIRENTPQTAAACMGRIAKLAGRWFMNRGMTIGIDDVTPSHKLQIAKQELLEKGYKGVEREIANYKKGSMQPNPGCTLDETLEARVKGILDDLRSIAGKAAQDALPPTNKPLIMFLSGAKGALINIAQMIALVGQQNVGGCRIQNGFVDRTLPHFKHKSQEGRARGFVAHSFYDGLDPEEFFFHTMSGREGLVDTAVKTAETGYMQRRLVKALEDLSLKYDRTVRTSDGQIVQFVYGDDGLDPRVMEDKAKPMSLDTAYHYVACMTKIITDLESTFIKKSTALPPILNDDEMFKCLDPHHSDIILPPIKQSASDMASIESALQHHLANVEKKVKQQMFNTRQMLAGLTPSDKETLRNNNRKRQRSGNTNTDNSNEKQQTDDGNQNTCVPTDNTIACDDISNSNTNIWKKKVILVSKESTLHGSNENNTTQNVHVPMFQQHKQNEKIKMLLPKPLPNSIVQKLRVMQSWKTSTKNNSFLSEHDPTYLHARANVLAHLTVSEWLPEIKQHAPLLPYEIIKWGEYLQKQCAEPLPIPIQEHQAMCMKEAPTHQIKTQEVRAFSRELTLWTQMKANEVANYLEENGMLRGDTEDSYRQALMMYRRNPSESTTTTTTNHIIMNHNITHQKLKKQRRYHHHCDASQTSNETQQMMTDSADHDDDTSLYFQHSYPFYPLARRGWIVPIQNNMSQHQPLSDENLNTSIAVEKNTSLLVDDNNNNDTLDIHRRWKYSQHYWITPRHLLEFFRLAWRKYNRALMEPGEAVGATGAQSIGEPGTQMTLKTFHFAGVASMNVTLGVPRIKEIINAATKIMTPIIQVPLINDIDFDYAVMVKSRIERTLLGEICNSIKEVYSPEGAYLTIKLDKDTISKLFLDITAESVRDSILVTPGLLNSRTRLKEEYVEVVGQYKLAVRPPDRETLFFDLQTLKQKIQLVHLAGLKDIKRGVIKREDRKGSSLENGKQYIYGLAVEGYGLLDVMATAGVDGAKCTSNHVMEVKDVLGIEAARRVIIDEIQGCMDAYSMDIDCRHMQLLGDVMTFRGDVLGISRFGIQKMRASTLMLASFEETNEHLFEAAAHHREDTVKGVSECIIMGKSVTLGTGAFDVFYNYKNQWTGAVLDGGQRTGSKTNKRSTLLLSKYGQIPTS